MILIHRPATARGRTPTMLSTGTSCRRAKRSRPTRSGSTSSSRPATRTSSSSSISASRSRPARRWPISSRRKSSTARTSARYMTARILCSSDTETPKLIDVSFILTGRALVTVRYGEPRSFSMFMTRAVEAGRLPPPARSRARRLDRDHHRPGGGDPRLGRQEASTACRATSSRTSEPGTGAPPVFRAAMQGARAQGRHHLQRAREHGVDRAPARCSSPRRCRAAEAPGYQARVAHGLARRAVHRGTRHVPVEQGAVSARRNARLRHHRAERHHQDFLGDVGRSSCRRPWSASIYGMNFKLMPELEWASAIRSRSCMMIVAAVLPYLFFRWKRWL